MKYAAAEEVKAARLVLTLAVVAAKVCLSVGPSVSSSINGGGSCRGMTEMLATTAAAVMATALRWRYSGCSDGSRNVATEMAAVMELVVMQSACSGSGDLNNLFQDIGTSNLYLDASMIRRNESFHARAFCLVPSDPETLKVNHRTECQYRCRSDRKMV